MERSGEIRRCKQKETGGDTRRERERERDRER
jgi:hypothetical protein